MPLVIKKPVPFYLMLLLSLVLSGCGFKLRGQLSGDLEGTNIYLNADDIFSALSVDLKRQLNMMNVNLNTGGKEVVKPAVSIFLKNIQEKRRTLSVDKTGRPVEYELILEVDVDIHDLKNNQADDPHWTTMHVRRVQVYDNNLLLAKSKERDEVRTEMRHVLISQIIERIRVYASQL